MLQDRDLCDPLVVAEGGNMGLPQLFEADITAHVHAGLNNTLTFTIYGRNNMHGHNHQSVSVWDLAVTRGVGRSAVPLTVRFENTSTKRSEGWLFGRSNQATTPMQYFDGIYACWFQSDPRWPVPAERQLYTALMRSVPYTAWTITSFSHPP